MKYFGEFFNISRKTWITTRASEKKNRNYGKERRIGTKKSYCVKECKRENIETSFLRMENEVFRGVFEIRYSNELKENGNHGGTRRDRSKRTVSRVEEEGKESFLFQGWKIDSRNSKENITHGRGTIRRETIRSNRVRAERSRRIISRNSSKFRGRPDEELETYEETIETEQRDTVSRVGKKRTERTGDKAFRGISSNSKKDTPARAQVRKRVTEKWSGRETIEKKGRIKGKVAPFLNESFRGQDCQNSQKDTADVENEPKGTADCGGEAVER